MTIKRAEVEGRVLAALQHELLEKELFAEFCAEFTRKMNRLRMEARASVSQNKPAPRRHDRTDRQKRRLHFESGPIRFWCCRCSPTTDSSP